LLNFVHGSIKSIAPFQLTLMRGQFRIDPAMLESVRYYSVQRAEDAFILSFRFLLPTTRRFKTSGTNHENFLKLNDSQKLSMEGCFFSRNWKEKLRKYALFLYQKLAFHLLYGVALNRSRFGLDRSFLSGQAYSCKRL